MKNRTPFALLAILTLTFASTTGCSKLDESAVTAAAVVAIDANRVAVGDSHSCFLTSEGGVACVGDNTNGELGNGSTTNSTGFVTPTGMSTGVASVVAGGKNTCAITTAGALQCWGKGGSGQLGGSADSTTPVAIAGLPGPIADAVMGDTSVCALTQAGGVLCWGGNDAGQLGNGTTTDSVTPAYVTGLDSGVTSIAGAGKQVCAVLAASTACWGAGTSGQLGNGASSNSTTPVTVTGLTNILSITAGESHFCAYTLDSVMKCWGDNTYGQLGTGTAGGTSSTPAVASAFSGVASVLAGGEGTCVQTTSGTIQCVGRNDKGQLGNGTTTSSATPVTVTGLTSLSEFAGGGDHACALAASGAFSCWGDNSSGQLGDGTTVSHTTPTTIIPATGTTESASASPSPSPSPSASPIPAWAGTKQFGVTGAAGTVLSGTKIDSSGNLFVCGYTAGALAGQTKVSDSGKNEVYVIKHDSAGTVSWIRQLGVSGAYTAVSGACAVDSSGNAYVTGYTDGAIDGQTKTSGATKNDMFVTKYSSAGTKAWTRQLGVSGAYNATPRGVAVDSSGNVFISGVTNGALDGQSKTSSSAAYNDFFVTKYDSSGTKAWTRQLGVTSTNETISNGLVVDSSGNVFVAGYTQGAIDGQSEMGTGSASDLFITKYDTSGTKAWTRQFGVAGAYSTFQYGVALDSSGNVLVSGITTGAMDGQSKISNSSDWDSFVVKFDSSGTKLWNRQLGSAGAYTTYGKAVDVDSSGNIFVGGYTTGAVDGQTKTSDASKFDLVVTKFDSSGTKAWTRQLGVTGANHTYLGGVVPDSSGNVIVGGFTAGAIDGQTKTSDATYMDSYLIKFSSDGTKQ